MQSRISKMLHAEAAPGIVLMIATAVAMLIKNSGLSVAFQKLLMMPIVVKVGEFGLDKPFLLWINDGLMAVFFLMVGLEIKKELLQGHLRTSAQRTLPFIAAIGGVVVPAAIYLAINWDNQLSRHGWAIPTATDIAFALGILILAGKRVPISLKIFLMALAIFDDLIAIIVVAIFYTSELSLNALLVSTLGILGLLGLNKAKVTRPAAYILCGVFMWICVLKSGVHATLAGVITGLLIPINAKPHVNPNQLLIDSLHPWVAFAILPLFALANAGISFAGLSFNSLLDPIPFGIAIALFFGKQIGVFGFAWVAIKIKLASMPEKANWQGLYAVSTLCGVGFTMSLFIGSLAFQYGGAGDAKADRLGILIGSLISGVVGFWLLKRSQKGFQAN
ncbi:Na+/H+ antiporter NhaA [Aliikangiella sp. IMCC44653]